jgi:hypothetical protein
MTSSPKGYSTAAYPDDYAELSEDELDAELDAASEWDDDEEDDDGGDGHDHEADNKHDDEKKI